MFDYTMTASQCLFFFVVVVVVVVLLINLGFVYGPISWPVYGLVLLHFQKTTMSLPDIPSCRLGVSCY